MLLDEFPALPLKLMSQHEGRLDRIGKVPAMATARTFGDSGSRAAPAMGVMRYALAREIVGRETVPRHTARAFMLGLDDATLATFGYDQMAVDHAGRSGFPL